MEAAQRFDKAESDITGTAIFARRNYLNEALLRERRTEWQSHAERQFTPHQI